MFWGLGHQRPNFDGYIYIHYATPPYSARISAMYFLPFGWVRLGSVSACNPWEAQCRIHEGWVRTLIWYFIFILSRLWTKVHEIIRRCTKPLVLFSALFRLSVSRFIQKIFAIKSPNLRKTKQIQKFCGPQFLWEGRCQGFYFILFWHFSCITRLENRK